ncbi:MAG: hypothetical protein AAGA40_03980 [Cyanobacteria bacterium P01_E01_bin.45]
MLPQLPSHCSSSVQSAAQCEDKIETAKARPVPPIEPRPIFQLEIDGWVLFAELVQSTLQSNGREMAWARPMLLVHKHDRGHTTIALEGVPDLLWPAAHFSPAYSEDLLPHLANSVTIPLDAARQQLRTFVQQVWDVREGCPAAG